jgi:DNA invertase Pin-like site-specific DNA recombinase
MKYGYARVSTDDQRAEYDYIFTDTASGTVKKRRELTRCLDSLRAGDVLIVWKLDRLGRSLSHLVVAVLSDLQWRGVTFRSLTEVIDTESAAGRLMGAYPRRTSRV